MKTKDLRKGNIIQEIDKAIVTIEALPFDNFIQYSIGGAINFGHIYGEVDESFEGVRITKDLLRRLESEQINKSMFKIGLFTLQPCNTNDGGDLVEKILSSRSGWKICFNGHYIATKEFVHEWQNLYQSITGEELTLSHTTT